jgi:catechol 2,3-dioxygenase-like lactoylglutathione lyase family enzyme
MTMQLRRIILFTPHLEEMTDFYSNVLGLEVTNREDGWVDFAVGPCFLALHAGSSKLGNRPPKLAFYASDVSRTRAALLKKGLAKAGPVKSTGSFDMCDCKDPDGNAFQISSRP